MVGARVVAGAVGAILAVTSCGSLRDECRDNMVAVGEKGCVDQQVYDYAHCIQTSRAGHADDPGGQMDDEVVAHCYALSTKNERAPDAKQALTAASAAPPLGRSGCLLQVGVDMKEGGSPLNFTCGGFKPGTKVRINAYVHLLRTEDGRAGTWHMMVDEQESSDTIPTVHLVLRSDTVRGALNLRKCDDASAPAAPAGSASAKPATSGAPAGAALAKPPPKPLCAISGVATILIIEQP